MNESQVKTRLVNWLLSQDDTLILGSEVPFSGRRADLISLKNEIASVYEIKAIGDKVSRLEGQLEDYKRFFDFCYVVCEPGNLSHVRGAVKRGIGIIEVSKNHVKMVRKPLRFKRHDKEVLLSVLDTTELRAISRIKSLLKSDLCKEASKDLTLERIRQLSRVKLKERYGPATDLLRFDIGSVATIDDLQTITKRPPLDLTNQP